MPADKTPSVDSHFENEDEKELFLRHFEEKLKSRLDEGTLKKLKNADMLSEDYESSDYEKFRLEMLPKSFSWYEKIANSAESLFHVKPDKKTYETIEKYLLSAHLFCTPTGVMSATLLVSLLLGMIATTMLLFFGMTIGMGMFLVTGLAYFVMMSIPSMFAKRQKAKAGDQIIIAVFYIVAYMRFSSNFELAVSFAARYLQEPLSLDFKRILWDLDNSKYSNIKNAFDDYLEEWRDTNLEFLEAIYLVESSLFESEEFRRISLLDKALDTILQGNYEKMLHFAQELRGKVQTFNMIGVVLPILGLIILPLAASFGDPKAVWQVVFILYDILFPVFVLYFALIIMYNRPASINSIKTPENVKNFKALQMIKYTIGKREFYVSAKIPAIGIFLLFLLIGMIPLFLHWSGADTILNERMAIFGSGPFSVFQEYKKVETDELIYVYGPYGVIPGLLSLFIPLSFAFGFGYYLKKKYRNLITLRNKTKELELQFPSATFQLGNRINEGISAELAFGAVADTMRGTEAGAFFSKIDANIKFNGLSVEKAIFDSEKGAINEYPSDLVVSSMKIFLRAVENGPEITAKSLIDLSRYLSEIHMGNERMNDLLAESLSSMRGQVSFLAPMISGVVISIVSLVTMIMGVLANAAEELAAEGNGADIGGFLGNSIPTYLFQSVVGMYMVMLIVILVLILTSLENGEDPVLMKYEIGSRLMSSMTKYAIIVLIGIIGFTMVGAQVLEAL